MGELIDGQPMFPGDDTLDQLNQITRILGPFNEHLMGLFHSNSHLKHLHFKGPESYQTLERRYRRKIDSEGLELLSLLLEMDPRKRVTAEQALQHAYFDSIRGDSYIQKPIPNNTKENNVSKDYKENVNQNKISLTNLNANDQPNKNYATLYLKDQVNSPRFVGEKVFSNTLSFLKVI